MEDNNSLHRTTNALAKLDKRSSMFYDIVS